MPDLGICGLEVENYIAIFEISTLEICLIAKICRKAKLLKFGTKNVLFGYFLPKRRYFGIFGQEL